MSAYLPLGAGLNLFEGDIKDYHRRLQHTVSKALNELFSSKMLNNIDYTYQLFSQSFKLSKYSETCAEKSNYKSYLKFQHIFNIHVPCTYFCF